MEPKESLHVKRVTFDGYRRSADGQLIIISVRDAAGSTVDLGFDWREAFTTVALFEKAAMAAKETRLKRGITDSVSDDQKYDGQMVVAYEAIKSLHGDLHILAFHGVNGLRYNLAFSWATKAPDGRPLPESLAQTLLDMRPATPSRPQ